MSTLSPSRLPETVDDLATLALRLISRLTWQGQHDNALGIRQALEPALIRHREYLALRTEPSKILIPAVHRADAAIVRFIGLCKASLRSSLGRRWNATWAEAGFGDGTLAVPASFRGREKLLKDLRDFLRTHPDLESTDGDISAVKAEQLLASLHAVRMTLHHHAARQRAAQVARRRACTALRKRLRMTVGRAPGPLS